jgi:predicted RNase H-like HicB family nuclease
MRGYVVVIEGDDVSGYSAYSPDVPGVVAAADDRREVEELMREALAEHLALLREAGRPVPEPAQVSDVTVVGPPAA